MWNESSGRTVWKLINCVKKSFKNESNVRITFEKKLIKRKNHVKINESGVKKKTRENWIRCNNHVKNQLIMKKSREKWIM